MCLVEIEKQVKVFASFLRYYIFSNIKTTYTDIIMKTQLRSACRGLCHACDERLEGED